MNSVKISTIAAVFLLAAGVAAIPDRAMAGQYVASNSINVVGDPSVSGRFETRQRGGKGGPDYWCAAGEYVIQSLHMSPGTRMYLEQPMGTSTMGLGRSIGFTVKPDAALIALSEGQSKPLSLSMKRVGDNWTAEHGRTECSIARDRRR